MRPEVVLVTGSRKWAERTAIEQCLERHPKGTILIHGDCAGADAYAARYGHMRRFVLWPLPYFEDQGKEARNASMVAVAAAFQAQGHKVTCYAFPLDGGRGTQKCMRLMRLAGLRIANWGDR